MEKWYTTAGNGRKAIVYLTPSGLYTVAHYHGRGYAFGRDFTTNHARSAEVAADNFVKMGRYGQSKLRLKRRGV